MQVHHLSITTGSDERPRSEPGYGTSDFGLKRAESVIRLYIVLILLLLSGIRIFERVFWPRYIQSSVLLNWDLLPAGHVYVVHVDGHACFAETANIDYRLSFAGQGKQTSVFRLPFAENKRKFAVSVFYICYRFKRKTIFLNPFIVFSSCKQSLSFGRLFTKKHAEVIRLLTGLVYKDWY